MKGSIEKIEAEIRERMKDPEGGFAALLTFPNKTVKKTYMMPFLYRIKNIRTGAFQKKQSVMNVAISYNPFTGKKLEDEK